MQKCSGEKVGVVRCPRQMPLQTPLDLCGGLRTDVARTAVAVGARDGLSDVIHAIMRALAPEKIRVRVQRDRPRRMQLDAGMHVNVVLWPDEGRLTEVSAFRKQRVERLQILVVRIAVATRHVGFQAKARRPRRMGKRVAGVARRRPRRNVAVAKRAKLINELEVPVPARVIAPQARADGMTKLARRAL